MRLYAQLTAPIIISFDRQIVDYGDYDVIYDDDDSNTFRHYIRLGARNLEHLDMRSQTFETIAVLLHEICHAFQRQTLGAEAYDSRDFIEAGTKLKRTDEHYALRETQARAFENKHIHNAVNHYDQLVAKISRNDRP